MQIDSALQLAFLVREQPADEIEVQQIGRMWPRLQRKAGLKTSRSRRAAGLAHIPTRVDRSPSGRMHLEGATGEALSTPGAPVHYVENGLLNSLFGLLCWQAIFAPVAGAFFHEFQAAPADLLAPDFRSSPRTPVRAVLRAIGQRRLSRHHLPQLPAKAGHPVAVCVLGCHFGDAARAWR